MIVIICSVVLRYLAEAGVASLARAAEAGADSLARAAEAGVAPLASLFILCCLVYSSYNARIIIQ